MAPPIQGVWAYRDIDQFWDEYSYLVRLLPVYDDLNTRAPQRSLISYLRHVDVLLEVLKKMDAGTAPRPRPGVRGGIPSDSAMPSILCIPTLGVVGM